jgi:hypothetical protein
VYARGGSSAIGPALFTSPIEFTSIPPDIFASYVFSPSIPVTAGHQYIAFVTNQPDGVLFEAPPDSGGSMFLKEDNPMQGESSCSRATIQH